MKRLVLFFATGIFLLACSTVKNTERWTVASEKADCFGVTKMKCLLVKTGGHNDWIFMYEPIQGFNYEPGYEYVIEVKKDTVVNPPADRSTYKYTFVKEISKVKKTSEDMPSIPLVK